MNNTEQKLQALIDKWVFEQSDYPMISNIYDKFILDAKELLNQPISQPTLTETMFSLVEMEKETLYTSDGLDYKGYKEQPTLTDTSDAMEEVSLGTVPDAVSEYCEENNYQIFKQQSK
tara:strand:- start:72 stop:425 length:354 start_codon:yes stop_codon:yes gene_type:complete